MPREENARLANPAQASDSLSSAKARCSAKYKLDFTEKAVAKSENGNEKGPTREICRLGRDKDFQNAGKPAGGDDRNHANFKAHERGRCRQCQKHRIPFKRAGERTGCRCLRPPDLPRKKYTEIDDNTDHRGGDCRQRRGKLDPPCVVSMNGPPIRMNRNDGKNVKNVATLAPSAAPRNGESGPSTTFVHPPT
jgi:hypothetical protein